MLKQINKFLVYVVVFTGLITAPAFAALSCSITTSAGCANTIVLRMSGATNAHAELPWQNNANYSNNVICCSGLSGVGCTGNSASVLKLSSSTNAHVEIATNSNYATTSCITSAQGTPVIAYQDTNCTGYDTTLASISSTTNATIGDTTNYTKKICGSLSPFSFSFNISTTTAFFGGLSSVATRYASSTYTEGDGSEVEAHNFTVKTNAPNGYTVNVQGGTLSSAGGTISAIGGTNISPSVGTSQFGLRIVPSGGIGAVNSPYAASGFAYNSTATTSSQVAGASSGDNATTTYSVRYVANISGQTPTGSYTSNLVYVATANF
jgi:hypothetical protein